MDGVGRINLGEETGQARWYIFAMGGVERCPGLNSSEQATLIPDLTRHQCVCPPLTAQP